MSDHPPHPRPLRRGVWFVVCVVVIGAGGLWFASRRNSAPVAPPPTVPVSPPDRAAAATNAFASAPAPALPATLESALRTLRSGASVATNQQTLAELQRALHTVPAGQAALVITQFLDAKSDAATGQEFKLGPGGRLEASPSLRTFLLDQLGQIDPAAAAAYARVILASMDSPDEWALALRNLAKGDPSEEGRKLATGKLQAMLTNTAWQQAPSVGFLEAFDVAVHLHSSELLSTLTDLVRAKDNQAVAHAAYLALDRLAISDPTPTLTALQANFESMAGREVTRANYFARADVRDPAQLRVVEAYLLNPALTAVELDKFSALYPNANFMVSHNLLTDSTTPSRAWLTGRDQETLNVVRRWQGEPRFERLRPQLQVIEHRLQQFVQQAQRN